MKRVILLLTMLSVVNIFATDFHKNYTNYNTSTTICSNKISSLILGKDGEILINTYAGLSIYDNDNWTTISTENGLSDNFVQSSCYDNDNNLWIGTYNGLCKFDGSNWKYYTTANGLSHNNVHGVVCDLDNNIWVSTYSGINKFDGENWQSFLSGKITKFITTDSNDNIWAGTWSNGAYKFDGSSWTNFNSTSGLVNNNVKTIFEDTLGNIWFGTSGGASKLNVTKVTGHSGYGFRGFGSNLNLN